MICLPSYCINYHVGFHPFLSSSAPILVFPLPTLVYSLFPDISPFRDFRLPSLRLSTYSPVKPMFGVLLGNLEVMYALDL